MLQNIKRLEGYTLGATDGEIGKVTDFFFDDQSWMIRYLVVQTGGWLMGRKVLISPQAITGVERDKELFDVNLTKEQIKNSPDVDTEQPVSRQKEIELHQYYPWQNYWGDPVSGMGMMGLGTTIPMQEAIELRQAKNEAKSDQESANDSHLRSCDELQGYVINATDGNVGDVKDFILDYDTWKIVFMIVDTGNWFPGKKVLLPPLLIKHLEWDSSAVEVNLSLEEVKNSPEYDPAQPLSDEYVRALSAYYSRYGK